MGHIAPYLFAGEVTFTVLKSLLLCTRSASFYHSLAVVLCFITESVLGIVLSTLLALRVLRFRGGDIVFKTGVATILATEVLSVLAEGSLIRSKISNQDSKVSKQGRRRREIMKWLSFLAGTVAMLCPFFWLHAVTLYYLPILLPFHICNTVLMVLSYKLEKDLKIRAMASVVYLAVGVAEALVLQFGSLLSDGRSGFHFVGGNSIAILCSAITVALTAIAAWGLPDVKDDGFIEEEHVKLLETVSFGITVPTVILGIARENGGGVQQVMLTILPQAGAIIIPVIVCNVKILFQHRREKNNPFDEI